MERSNYPVIPCETCGKLFRPVRPDQDRCRQCADMPESAEELPRVAIPFLTRRKEIQHFENLIPVTRVKGVARRPPRGIGCARYAVKR